MTVLISGYLPSGNDESLKYEKTVPFEYISQVMEVMRWKKGGNCSGQPIPDSGLSFSSATAGGNPSLN
ncbi:pyocin S6 family toxin immunity protein [Pseudomonas aeruginosa]|uniref:pyocin S6 family toxin immunity protein n=1 Tax=Pseudomonas aeruginosa TaxID=287 RepID=UPI000F522BEE|nr:hypothetical protein IPC1301_19020 [Pseudomonas aeruginosa]